MNKKKIIILSAASLLLIITLVVIIFSFKNNSNKANNKNTNNISVGKAASEFLSVEEKSKLGIPVDKKIQAVSRDKNGELTVYKVINDDSDVAVPSVSR